MPGRRPFKFQEFAGHSGDVRCISIGRKSCQVLATGGEDKKVNVWALGKPNALMSLSGHTSSVESVTFDTQEEVVVAGAASGTIKLWDLDQAKAIRTLVGHRSDCMAVDFHPYGAFFASGSLDTNLKVWDIRRKACIQTYKGHVQGVNTIRFSPDGKWVVSGGEDGFVKLWDLTAGKLLYEYQHDGAVTSLDFHPSELLLASGSTDRSVRLVDLEALKPVGCTPAEGSGAGVSAAFFSGDGNAVMSVSGEYMKVWAFDPQVALMDTVEAGWGGLGDVCVNASSQAVACTLHQSFVQVWALNLSSLRPWASGEGGANAAMPQEAAVSGAGSGALQQGALESSPAKGEDQASLLKQFVAAQKRAEEERLAAEKEERAEAAQSHRDREGAGGNATPAVNDKENLQGGDAEGDKRHASMKADVAAVLKADVAAEGRRAEGRDATKALQERLSSLQQMWGGMQEDRDKNTAARPARGRGWGEAADSPPTAGIGHDMACHQFDDDEEVPSDEDGVKAEEEAVPMQRAPFLPPPPEDPEPQVPREIQDAAPHSQHLEVHMSEAAAPPSQAEFAPSGVDQRMDNSHVGSSQRPLCEGDVLDGMLRESAEVHRGLRKRLGHVRDVLNMWQKGDVSGALQAAAVCVDDGAVCDVLSCATKQPHVFTLDSFVVLLPRLTQLLESETEDYTLTAMHTIQILVRTFNELIHHTRSAVLPPGVDISAEERRRKCDMVYASLQTCSAGGGLAGLRKRPGKVGALARGVIAAIEAMR